MDAPIHITREDVVTAARDALAEVGEGYVYRKPLHDVREQHSGVTPPCRYVHTARMRGDNDHDRLDPGCYVGTILNKLGVDLSALAEIDESHAFGGATSDQLLAHLQDDRVITYTRDAADFLSLLQVTQDHGQPWGVAYREALAGRSTHERYDDL